MVLCWHPQLCRAQQDVQSVKHRLGHAVPMELPESISVHSSNCDGCISLSEEEEEEEE
jgi:hypothetical protein